MIRNDYRRALIMLRGLENGYSGHVRLERRTLNGTVQFTVNSAPSAQPLHALLLSEKNGRYQAVNLGALRRDSRGQYALMAAFDPRNIQGLDLNDYALLGVARTGNDGPALVMSGYVNGTRQINWRGVRDAVTRLFVTQQTPSREPVTLLNEAPESAATGTQCCCDPAQPAPAAQSQTAQEELAQAAQTGQAPQEELAQAAQTGQAPQEEPAQAAQTGQAPQEEPAQAAQTGQATQEESVKASQPAQAAQAQESQEDSACPQGESETASPEESAAVTSVFEPIRQNTGTSAQSKAQPVAPAQAQTQSASQTTPAQAQTQSASQTTPAQTQTQSAAQTAPAQAQTQSATQTAPAQAQTQSAALDPFDMPAVDPISDGVDTTGSGGQAASESAAPSNAAQNLAIEGSWPACIFTLRPLFEQNQPFEPFAAPGYVFVRAPISSDAGEQDYCAIGIRAEGGKPRVLCYALPGTFALEPPPGLEGYYWRGTGRNGWWVTFIDLITGEPISEEDA